MLSDEDVLQIYAWYVEGMPVTDIAKHFDVTDSHVYNIVKGRTRRNLYDMYFPRSKKEKGEE